MTDETKSIEQKINIVSETLRKELRKENIVGATLTPDAIENVKQIIVVTLERVLAGLTPEQQIESSPVIKIVNLGIQLEWGGGTAKELEVALKSASLITLQQIHDTWGPDLVPLFKFEWMFRQDNLKWWKVKEDNLKPEGYGRDVVVEFGLKYPLNYIRQEFLIGVQNDDVKNGC